LFLIHVVILLFSVFHFKRPLFEAMALTLHEGNPGHHMQVSANL